MRDWNEYHQKNKYSECQLITALNIYYYLTGKYIDQESDEYEELVDLCLARYGSAISIKKVWDKLGIKVKESYLNSLDWSNKKQPPLPMEINIWHKSYGFHSVAAIDYEPKTDAFKIANFKWATSLDGWIFYEDLNHFIIKNPDREEPRYCYRFFELTKTC